MTHPKLDDILERLNVVLQNRYGERLAGIRLFGSQARGEANEDSDIDILVILKDEEVDISGEQDALFSFKYDLEEEYDTLIQILFTTEERFRNCKAPMYMAVRAEGKDLPLTHLASEKVLAKDWSSPEEDEIWKNLS